MSDNVANREQAEKCRDMATAFMQSGQTEKAVRFFDKSLRLFPLPGVEALRDKAVRMQHKGASSSSGGGNGSNGTSSSSSSSRVNSSASAPRAQGSQRAYTPEQEAGAKKIVAASKKSHYDVLRIQRDASDDDIKRAYRKLALKYHPDKNSAPSAEAAFKAINTASDTLSDSAKRENYDAYGHEDPSQAAAQGGFGGGMRYRSRAGSGFASAARGMQQEMNPEDLFDLFFAGGRGGAFRQGGRGQRRREEVRLPRWRVMMRI
jgi:DnaJ-domain-containing protein 1